MKNELQFSCRTCRFLAVEPDRDGVIRPRAAKMYPCTVEIPAQALPASVRRYVPPKPGYMEPKDGVGCLFWKSRSEQLYNDALLAAQERRDSGR